MSLSCLSISHFFTKMASVPARIQSCKIGYSLNEYINFPVKTMSRLLSIPMAQRMVSFAVQVGGPRYENYCRKRAAKLVEATLPKATENVRQLVVDNVVKPLLANIDRSTAEKAIQLNTNSATGYAVLRAIEACPWLSAATKISNLTSLSLLPARAIVLSAAVWIAGPAVQKGIELVKNDEAVLVAQYKAAILSRNPGLQKIAEDIQNGEQGKKALEALIQSTLEKQITKIILLGSEEAAVQKVADLKS